jgi:hypothetical protein
MFVTDSRSCENWKLFTQLPNGYAMTIFMVCHAWAWLLASFVTRLDTCLGSLTLLLQREDYLANMYRWYGCTHRMLIRSSTCGFHKMEIIPFICTWWTGKGPIALGSSVFGSGINNNTSCPGWLSCNLCFKLSRWKFSSINHCLFWLTNKGISRNMSWWNTNSPGNTFIVQWMAAQCVCWLVPCSSKPH